MSSAKAQSGQEGQTVRGVQTPDAAMLPAGQTLTATIPTPEVCFLLGLWFFANLIRCCLNAEQCFHEALRHRKTTLTDWSIP